MKNFRIYYLSGIRELVSAENHGKARSIGRRLQPDHEITSIRVAKDMAGLELTDWNTLVFGNNRVKCSMCQKYVVPSRVWDGPNDVEKRPCHDDEGRVFCNVGHRDEFVERIGTDVEWVSAFDYDTWASVDVAVPLDKEKFREWADRWSLIEMGDRTVIISTERYNRMRHQAQKSGIEKEVFA